jgi:group I intron endonuclease
MIGIYKITNKINNKAYVGWSNNIERRFKEHQTCGGRSRIPLDLAIQKYGINNFTYEIIEECSIEELNERETYWITTLETHLTGYNCNTGGD